MLAVAALTCVLAGCGEESEDQAGASETSGAPASATPASESPTAEESPTTAPEPNDAAELRTAVVAYSDAFLTGDVEAYEMFSQRCRDRTSKNEFVGILAAANSTYGSALPIKTFDPTISGDLARVTYTYELAAINQDSEPWVREQGEWKQDDC